MYVDVLLFLWFTIIHVLNRGIEPKESDFNHVDVLYQVPARRGCIAHTPTQKPNQKPTQNNMCKNLKTLSPSQSAPYSLPPGLTPGTFRRTLYTLFLAVM